MPKNTEKSELLASQGASSFRDLPVYMGRNFELCCASKLAALLLPKGVTMLGLTVEPPTAKS